MPGLLCNARSLHDQRTARQVNWLDQLIGSIRRIPLSVSVNWSDQLTIRGAPHTVLRESAHTRDRHEPVVSGAVQLWEQL